MTIHYFEPNMYYNTLGPHEPVLRIRSGDSVVTSTIDARGADKNREHVGSKPNPMTGPFYVENARQGDTLAVYFDQVTPSRNSGWTANVLDHQVLDAEAFRDMPPREILQWEIDPKEGTVRLSQPLPVLGDLKRAISPFLGCFGVAPARKETISTATSAEHGGNMDYRRLTAGSTVYFPVFEAGALLFLGDGHANQGDGEIVGNGIETSMDVKFTVNVIRGQTIGWPRGEDDAYIFTIGNAKPLELAVKYATTEMLRWLRHDYGLNDVEASTILGQYVEYEVGNLYNPAYTMVCKMKKTVLTSLPV